MDDEIRFFFLLIVVCAICFSSIMISKFSDFFGKRKNADRSDHTDSGVYESGVKVSASNNIAYFSDLLWYICIFLALEVFVFFMMFPFVVSDWETIVQFRSSFLCLVFCVSIFIFCIIFCAKKILFNRNV